MKNLGGRPKRAVTVKKDRIRELMEKYRVTAFQIGDVSGYSPDTVMINIRKGSVSPELLTALAKLLHVAEEELRGEE